MGECCDACYGNAKCVAYTYRTPTRTPTRGEHGRHGSAATTATTPSTTSSGSCYLKDNATPHAGGEPGGHVSGVIPGRAPGGGARIEEIINAVGAVNTKTVVSAVVPGQILTDWRGSAAAILVAFLPGEQYGNAIADIIFGDATPQAKLPLTFPNVENEQKMTTSQYPGVKTDLYSYEATYTEGQIVGYRWYDKHSVKPAFPFGHGLTYGSVKYANLQVSGRTVSFDVANTDTSASPCDTPQVYIGYPGADKDPAVPSKVRGRGRRRVITYIYIRCYTATDPAMPFKVMRCTIISYNVYTPFIHLHYHPYIHLTRLYTPYTPRPCRPKVMRYFQKVCFNAPSDTSDTPSDTPTQSTQSVSYTLTDRDVSNWDVEGKKWAVTTGAFAVFVGSSSQDIRLTGTLTV